MRFFEKVDVLRHEAILDDLPDQALDKIHEYTIWFDCSDSQADQFNLNYKIRKCCFPSNFLFTIIESSGIK